MIQLFSALIDTSDENDFERIGHACWQVERLDGKPMPLLCHIGTAVRGTPVRAICIDLDEACEVFVYETEASCASGDHTAQAPCRIEVTS